MKEIIIRTNFNTKVGLGHFFRCKILKEKFEKKNFKVTFIIDNITKSKLTKNINILNLNQKRFNYLEDSKLVYEKIKNRDVCLILVDDYRIDFKWEKIFVKKGYIVAIIDDLANRKHYCDFLIDSGWYGKKKNVERRYRATSQVHVWTSQRSSSTTSTLACILVLVLIIFRR